MRRDGQLSLRERAGLHNTSSSESDKYEELIVNPTLLTLSASAVVMIAAVRSLC
jgi:hypothetical protein